MSDVDGSTGAPTGALTGRVAVVTGASYGIGRALALALAAQGAIVVGSGRSADRLDEMVTEVAATGATVRGVVADATDPVQARRPVLEAVEAFGHIDILINNVGGRLPNSQIDGDPFACDDDSFLHIVTLNLLATWWASSAALGPMRERGYGRIICIGSGNSIRAGSPPYAASKHGLVGLTRSLANAAAPHGITVNCLCPGWTATPHNDWAVVGKRMGGITAEAAKARAESENAQHRVLEPGELGPMAVLLASEAGGSMTGQVVHVDGGWKL